MNTINDAEENGWTKAEWSVAGRVMIDSKFTHSIQVEASPPSQALSICPYQGRRYTPTPTRKIRRQCSDRFRQVPLRGRQNTYRGTSYGV